MKRWNPDFVFGFIAVPVAYKGFAERMGYFHTEPGALRWLRKGSDKAMEGFITYLSNDDARFMLDLPIARPASRKSDQRAA